LRAAVTLGHPENDKRPILTACVGLHAGGMMTSGAETKAQVQKSTIDEQRRWFEMYGGA